MNEVKIDKSPVQIAPNAKIMVQNYYTQDIRTILSNRQMWEEENLDSEILDMYYISFTKPRLVENEILRKAELELCEKRLAQDNILCLYGDEGVGVTTLLAQFAKTHGANCVSYFYNGLDSLLLNKETMNQSIIEQLYWYIRGEKLDNHFSSSISLNYICAPLYKKLRKSDQPLYFVFDGFDDLPSDKIGEVKQFFENMFWNDGRFIFSGKKENIEKIIPTNKKLSISENEILNFDEAAVKDYFRKIDSSIDEDGLAHLYSITRGLGSRMNYVMKRYVQTDRLNELLSFDYTGDSDLYKDDYQHIFDKASAVTYNFYGTLAFAGMPLDTSILSEILSQNIEETEELLKKNKDFVVISENGLCRFRDEGFHKYLKDKLKESKRRIELNILHVLQRPNHVTAYCSTIPSLMVSLNETDSLLAFLSMENVQQILVSQKSQAALNEQCDYGYRACQEKPEKNYAKLFRFILNKSTSREIENNELWDNELEALLATGHSDQAITLAQDIYLSEERLKSFLLIAHKKDCISAANYEIVRTNINRLVDAIQFEKIPEKAIELAKLLLPIDYKKAMGIVDRVTTSNKEAINADKVYTLMSLMAYKTGDDTGNVTNFDLVSDKIEDEELRSFTHAAKSLFEDVSVDHFLDELHKLPNDSRKLQLLQIWLPAHKDKENIGKAVLEALQLIVAVSDTDMPKARILKTVCQSMGRMNQEDMTKAMSYIESIKETVKYPTYDYIDAELTIIEATKDKLPNESKTHLEDLYLYILDLDDASVRLACLSKLLGRFEYLGSKSTTEKILGTSTVELRHQIIDGLQQLLGETAYHVKIVEEPIKALVCDYPTMIDEIIKNVNTKERRNRVYSLAAFFYLTQQDEQKIDLNRFFALLSKTDNVYGNRDKPLRLLSRLLYYADDIDHESFLPLIKKHFHYYEEIEETSKKIIAFMRIYIWMKKHFASDSFADKIKKEILESWKSINVLKEKIECGYFLVKQFAKESKDDAEEILQQCNKMKTGCFLTSSSCVNAYNIALELYSRSMGLLVRNHIDNCSQMLHQFEEDVDMQLSTIEKAITWSTIALEYYLANDNDQFHHLCAKYFPTDLSSYSIWDQKCLLWGISPALYYYSCNFLFEQLQNYDEQFQNDVLKHILIFIICKEAAFSSSTLEFKAYDLSFKDYQDLILLLEHGTDDDLFFQTTNIVAKSILEGKPKQVLSTEQKSTVIKDMVRIITEKLPTKNGIQHDGYKTACLATLEHATTEFSNRDIKKWDEEISKIDNKADQAFLYFEIAPYFQKRGDKERFFQKGISVTGTIPSLYDKENRFSMSISECAENNFKNLIKPLAESALTTLKMNGTLEDYKRLIDMIYQNEPELAEEMVDNIDDDPARISYKKRLQKHISSAKRLKEAHKELDDIDNLTSSEQVKFFRNQLDDLVNGKGQILDVVKTFKLTAKHIFDHNIDQARFAVLYIMENLFLKYRQSKSNQGLLVDIHQAIRFNLQMVLSLAVDTEDRLNQLECLMGSSSITDDGFIQVGEEDKARAYITNWYKSKNYSSLTIIDPYFKPSDLDVIKNLCDINNDLEINILCHRQKYQNEDYLKKWNHISSGVTNSITIHFMWYKNHSENGPLHDRYWISENDDTEEKTGLKLCSMDSLGRKESSITAIEKGIIDSALNSYYGYVYKKKRNLRGEELMYDEIELR
jgi:hypothetical protein